MLLVLNLQLMEVDKLQVITHLLFVLDLRLGLGDLRLQRCVLEGKLPDEGIFCAFLVFHVLNELFGIIFASATVLGCGEESTEIEGFLSYLSDGQIGTLKDGLKSLQQCLGAISAAFNTLLKCLQLGVSDLVLLLGGEPPLVVDECSEELLLLYPLLLRHLCLALVIYLLLLLLQFAGDVRLEELVLAADLLIVLLNVHELVVELLEFHILERGS